MSAAPSPADPAIAPTLKPASNTLHAALLLMTALWSMNFYAAKVVTSQLEPFPSAALRSVFGCAAILVYFFTFVPGARGLANRSQILRFMGLGTIGVGINQLFFMEGMARTSVAHGALIIALTPAIVLILSALTGQERITVTKITGLALATAGIAFLQGGPDRTKGSTLLGDALVLGASTSFATYSVLAKRLAGRSPEVALVTYGFLGSALAFLPGLLWIAPQAPTGNMHFDGWLALLYMSLGSSVVCYIIYNRALESMPASRVSALSYLQPLMAITTAIPLLGEPITKPLVIGGILILLGVLLAERG